MYRVLVVGGEGKGEKEGCVSLTCGVGPIESNLAAQTAINKSETGWAARPRAGTAGVVALL